MSNFIPPKAGQRKLKVKLSALEDGELSGKVASLYCAP